MSLLLIPALLARSLMPWSPASFVVTLGIPPRLIAFFSLLLLILFVTGVVPSSHSSSLSSSTHGIRDTRSLSPHDYLNASLAEPAPFSFCPVYGPGDEVSQRRGQTALLKSKLHLGTGARMQRVIRKALSGAPLTISVLGASSTSCSSKSKLRTPRLVSG